MNIQFYCLAALVAAGGGVLVWLVGFSNRAGRNAAAVTQAEADSRQADQTARTTADIAQAGADSPRDVRDQIAELKKGQEGEL